MPTKDNNIIKDNQGEKSIKLPFVVYNYEKKKMIPLKKEEKIHYNEQQICYICKKEFDTSTKKHYKVRDHCHYTGKYIGAAHNICNLRNKIPKEIPLVFHNGSIYDYHFIIIKNLMVISSA